MGTIDGKKSKAGHTFRWGTRLHWGKSRIGCEVGV